MAKATSTDDLKNPQCSDCAGLAKVLFQEGRYISTINEKLKLPHVKKWMAKMKRNGLVFLSRDPIWLNAKQIWANI